MKKLYLFLLFFTVSCYVPTQEPAAPVAPNPPVDTTPASTGVPTLPPPDFTNNVEDDDDRDRRGSSRSSDICEEDRNCEDICDDIFKSSRDRRDCEELEVRDVEDMEEAYEALEDADDFDDIDLDALKNIFDISVEPIVEALEDYSSSDAKDFFTWLFDEDTTEGFEIFKDNDDDFEMLHAALRNLNSDVVEALSNNIDGSDNVMEYLLDQDHEEALEWVHEFLTDGSGDSNNGDCDGEETCIFSKYCDIADDISDRDDMADYDYFSDFMEDLLNDNDFEYFDEESGDYRRYCGNRTYDTNDRGSANRDSSDDNNDDNPSRVASGSCLDKLRNDESLLNGNNNQKLSDSVVYFALTQTTRFDVSTGAALSGGDGKYCPSATASNSACNGNPASVASPQNRRIKNLKEIKVNGAKHTFKFKKDIVVDAVLLTDDGADYRAVSVEVTNSKTIKVNIPDSRKNTNKFGIILVKENNNGGCKVSAPVTVI